MKLNKIVIAVIIAIITVCSSIYFSSFSEEALSCKANVNLYLSSELFDAPVINGIISVNLKHDGDGMAEFDGVIEWKGNTYPVSKFIRVKHDLTSNAQSLFTVSAVSIASREYDKSPPGVVERFIIGDPALPERIFYYKRIFDNGYLISNFNSPIAICVDR